MKKKGNVMQEDGIALHVQTHIPVFTIYSSHGELLVELETGKVYNCTLSPEGEGIDQIAKFDIKEYEAYHNERIEEASHLDILDFGYWTKDGQYEEPEKDWREMIKQMHEEETVGTDAHKKAFRTYLESEFKRRTGLEGNDIDFEKSFDGWYKEYCEDDMSVWDIVSDYIEKYDLTDLKNSPYEFS